MYSFWQGKENLPIEGSDREAFEQYQAQVRALESELGDDEDVLRTVVVIVAATLVVGPFVDRLIALTGYPKDFVASVCGHMEFCGLWTADGAISADWLNEDGTWDFIRLCCDMGIAQGWVTTWFDKNRGEWICASVRDDLKN